MSRLSRSLENLVPEQDSLFVPFENFKDQEDYQVQDVLPRLCY